MILDSNIVIYAFEPKYRESSVEDFLLQGEFSVSNVTRLEAGQIAYHAHFRY